MIKIKITEQLQCIIRYYDILLKENPELENFAEDISEQNENLDDLVKRMEKFNEVINDIECAECLERDATIDKLIKIHSFLVDFDWHISEVYDLNKKFVKLCSEKRESL
ncbi:MAG: hypothetical protein JEZ08_24850 [Clostridiales bacterium]|nr:hypothetical protein [Clostridiales bacterium]